MSDTLEEIADNPTGRPLVTFALFAYNQEDYIREAVEGALAQTYSPLEIILSDDCSTDQTFQIMQEMVAAYRGPHQITLQQTPENLGRKKFGLRVWSLLRQAEGELIILAAGDDISADDRTITLYETWSKNKCQAVCIHSNARVIDEHGNPVKSVVGHNRIASMPLELFVANDGRGLLGATSAISQKLLEHFEPFPDLILMEDAVLAFRARLLDGILFVAEPLVSYRRHSGNMTNGTELLSEENFEHHITALRGQHHSYLSDYAANADSIDPKITGAIARRLGEISEMKLLFCGGYIKRLRALWLYSRRLPIKRRIYLFRYPPWSIGRRTDEPSK